MNLKKNPELVPLIEWWEKDGKSTVLWIVVAALAVGGFYGWKGHRAATKAAASDAVVNAYTTEEIEDAVAKFGGTDAGGALKLRLAKNYFDNGRYDEALAKYEELDGKAPDGFADVPAVGKAQCLEAKGQYAEAQAAFDAFVQATPNGYLTLTAQLGAARCLAQQGKKDEALKRLAAMKDALKDDDMIAKARVETTEKLVKRYEKKAAVAAPAKAEKPAKAAAPAKAASPAKAEKPAK